MNEVGVIDGDLALETDDDDGAVVAWMAVEYSFDSQAQLSIIDFCQWKSDIDDVTLRLRRTIERRVSSSLGRNLCSRLSLLFVASEPSAAQDA
jgi:hypothetical protein